MSTENKKLIIEKFREVRDRGFLPATRSHNTGIGKTFEDYIGKTEDNRCEPDLAGFEIKSHRDTSSSYITLLTKSPSFPRGANTYLRDRFGTPYEEAPNLKKLHTSMFATCGNTYCGLYSFRLLDTPTARMLTIAVTDIGSGMLIDNSVGYTYDALERVFYRKLKNLFYISAATRRRDDGEEFHFNRADIYTQPSFERFLHLIRTGKIMYDIRIGTYRRGRMAGRTHDHGSGFRIMESDLRLLYACHEAVE